MLTQAFLACIIDLLNTTFDLLSSTHPVHFVLCISTFLRSRLPSAAFVLFQFLRLDCVIPKPYPPPCARRSLPPSMPTWCIVGASRGIGFEFVRQLLERGDQVIAAVRDPFQASQLWQLSASQERPGACELCQCDVTSEESINVRWRTLSWLAATLLTRSC